MDARKVVVRKMKGNRRLKVFSLLRKAVRQASEAAHLHTHGEVLTVNLAGRNVLPLRYSYEHLLFLMRHLRRRITSGSNWFSFVKFDYLGIVDISAERSFNGVGV
jgi:hypothetical protein